MQLRLVGKTELSAAETANAAAGLHRFGRTLRVRFEMLARGAQHDAGEPPGNREDDFVDAAFVEHREHRVESATLIFGAVRVGSDGNADAASIGFTHQALIGGDVLRPLLLAFEAVELPCIDLDGHPARVREIEQTVFVFLELFLVRPMTENRRAIEVSDHMPGQFLDIFK